MSPSSMIGAPSGPAIQPGSVPRSSRCASRILLPATELIEASKMNGGSVRAGAAMEIGFNPSMAVAPPVGAIATPPAVIATPTMSCSSAIAA